MGSCPDTDIDPRCPLYISSFLQKCRKETADSPRLMPASYMLSGFSVISNIAHLCFYNSVGK